MDYQAVFEQYAGSLLRRWRRDNGDDRDAVISDIGARTEAVDAALIVAFFAENMNKSDFKAFHRRLQKSYI